MITIGSSSNPLSVSVSFSAASTLSNRLANTEIKTTQQRLRREKGDVSLVTTVHDVCLRYWISQWGRKLSWSYEVLVWGCRLLQCKIPVACATRKLKPFNDYKKLKVLFFYPMFRDFRKNVAFWEVPMLRPFVFLLTEIDVDEDEHCWNGTDL